MKLDKISFDGFRCFDKEIIELHSYTPLVGPNNCGKSTVLKAISALYDGYQLTASDFCVARDSDEIRIRFEFKDLDESALSDLSHYVRNGRVAFEIVGRRNIDGQVSTKCRGVRYGLPEVAPFFEENSAAARRAVYERLQSDGASLPAWKNMSQAENAIRSYESENTARHVAIPSEENAYGATGPIPKIRKHLDWIYIPAVKDATSEATELRNSAFSKLVLLAVRSKNNFQEKIREIQDSAGAQLQSAIADAEDVLTDIGVEIDTLFKSLTTSRVDITLQWNDPDELALREPSISTVFKDGQVRGAPEVFGHGIQRTYLMALLSLAARASSKNSGTRLLIGVEEPELYQHPPQARYLSNALMDLSRSDNQIVVTTHSPYFISSKNFDSIKTLKKSGNVTKINFWSIDEQRSYCAKRLDADMIGAKAALSGIDRSLTPPISEMFFSSKIVLVEGPEDVAIILSFIEGNGLLREFLSHGCHIIPVGGKQKMPMLIAMARGFGLDVFTVFDMDLDKSDKEQCNSQLIRYAKDTDVSINLEVENYFSSRTFFAFRNNIQNSIQHDVADWFERAGKIAEEWGWTYSRMNKDPMLVEECIARVLEDRVDIPSLNELTRRLMEFWQNDASGISPSPETSPRPPRLPHHPSTAGLRNGRE